MTQSVYNIVKAPLGWSIYCDGMKIGGAYGSKEAALEAATVAASFAVRDGAGVQINIPSSPEPDEIPGNWVSSIKWTRRPAVSALSALRSPTRRA
jgi:hypothetical protein